VLQAILGEDKATPPFHGSKPPPVKGGAEPLDHGTSPPPSRGTLWAGLGLLPDGVLPHLSLVG
jgi:hypothetical protein